MGFFDGVSMTLIVASKHCKRSFQPLIVDSMFIGFHGDARVSMCNWASDSGSVRLSLNATGVWGSLTTSESSASSRRATRRVVLLMLVGCRWLVGVV